jgi:hypothetical protein
MAQSGVLVADARRFELRIEIKHGLLGRLEHGVEPANHRHWKDDVAILAPHINVAEHVVGNVPDEAGDPVDLAIVIRHVG